MSPTKTPAEACPKCGSTRIGVQDSRAVFKCGFVMIHTPQGWLPALDASCVGAAPTVLQGEFDTRVPREATSERPVESAGRRITVDQLLDPNFPKVHGDVCVGSYPFDPSIQRTREATSELPIESAVDYQRFPVPINPIDPFKTINYLRGQLEAAEQECKILRKGRDRIAAEEREACARIAELHKSALEGDWNNACKSIALRIKERNLPAPPEPRHRPIQSSSTYSTYCEWCGLPASKWKATEGCTRKLLTAEHKKDIEEAEIRARSNPSGNDREPAR